MDSSIFFLHNICNVGKSDGLLVNANVLQEFSKISPSCLVHISQNTIFELSVLLEPLVSANFFMNPVLDYVLVSKNVFYLHLVYWHLALLGVLHSIFVVLKSILDCEVLFFTQLCELLFRVVGASTVNHFLAKLSLLVQMSSFVFQHMKQNFSLFSVEVSNNWNELSELFLVFFMLFKLSLRLEVHNLNSIFEIFRLGVER